ncbi:CHRD domain-containing protein [Streptomyces sp. H27-C3]|uniref:CHRD domain-containing protein n=1 Tax=Streptomyces sp. H27-C3 TaxID=3046305 RepID=UPI0024B8BA4B|nr:CHRD domain-containing protein [Streptomyces sp. H27-C3]MDJ0464364.1 CHRD domain-containing protein [Streptomyces sp. H27-C3]
MSDIAQRRRTRKTILIATTAVAAAAGVTLAALPAFADSGSTSTSTRGDASFFAASLKGGNEVPVPGGPAAGDKDGAALEFLKVEGSTVSFAVKWRGADRPTALHIHQGGRGVNGGVKIDFTDQLGKSESGRSRSRSLTGSVEVKDAALLDAFKAGPTGFYANLHTAEFPGGAVRGQFHKVTNAFDFGHALKSVQAPVLRGKQIYECKKRTDGKFSFQQRDVRAVLAGGIAHSFVEPNSGTPQWIAPDRSAVTGAVISRTPNGAANIPELDLQAQQSGKKRGLLAHTGEILRLNTVGGVAPAGSCTEGSLAAVSYRADYVFIQR